MQAQVDRATPNDAHIALAEHDIPIITMNIDGLHQRAGSKHILPIHGTLPDIILYEDPAPLYGMPREYIEARSALEHYKPTTGGDHDEL